MSEIKSNRAWREECESLRQQVREMQHVQAGFMHLSDMRQAMIDTADENVRLRQRVNEYESRIIGVGEVAINSVSREKYDAVCKELAALKKSHGEPMTMDAIYAAWHGAGVDIAGGDWNRFAKMLPPLYTSATNEIEILRRREKDLEKNVLFWEAQAEALRQQVKKVENTIADYVPVAWHNEQIAKLKESQGEPVAWLTYDANFKYMLIDDPIAYHKAWPDSFLTPVYTTPTIPEGWQLVPIEPTEKMLDSCDEVQIWKTWDGGRFYMDWGMAESAYKAMLAAAPKPGNVK